VITSSAPDLSAALATLRSGGLIAYPTETYYALGCDARLGDAATAVFALKGRPGDAPLPLILPDASWLTQVAREVPRLAHRLAARYWPGPLTLVVPAASWVPSAVHAGTGTVGVRVSLHPVATRLARELGAPLCATSANPSGELPVRDPEAVRRYFPQLVIVDAGETPGGAASTVVGFRRDETQLLRAGAVAWDEILRVIEDP
jgi:L-threonylcarbamoyladenylate synthase